MGEVGAGRGRRESSARGKGSDGRRRVCSHLDDLVEVKVAKKRAAKRDEGRVLTLKLDHIRTELTGSVVGSSDARAVRLQSDGSMAPVTAIAGLQAQSEPSRNSHLDEKHVTKGVDGDAEDDAKEHLPEQKEPEGISTNQKEPERVKKGLGRIRRADHIGKRLLEHGGREAHLWYEDRRELHDLEQLHAHAQREEHLDVARAVLQHVVVDVPDVGARGRGAHGRARRDNVGVRGCVGHQENEVDLASRR